MSSPLRRYVRIPKGQLTKVHLSHSARELLALCWQSALTNRIPGVIRAGHLALSEEFNIPQRRVARDLDELWKAGLIAVDQSARLLRVRGAIETDPPASSKVLTAWAIDIAELPASSVRDEVWRTIHDCIEGEQKQGWIALTRAAVIDTRPETASDTVSHTLPDTAGVSVSHTPSPYPDPFPDPFPDPAPSPEPGPLPSPTAEKPSLSRASTTSANSWNQKIQARLVEARRRGEKKQV